MSRISKFLALTMIAAALLTVGCSKPPVQEMDNAKAAMKAAQESGAEKCASEEYQKAKASVESAEAKMAEAEKGGSKSELYKQAKEELLQAIADFEKAKEKAAERSKINDKAQAELDAAKKNLDAAAASDGEYSASYKAAKAKLDEAQALIDKCEGEKAMEVLKQVEIDKDAIQKEIMEAKAESMKAESTQAAVGATLEDIIRYTVVKGDNLWNISKAKYQNPFMWPLIYWANKSMIKDPDLIFPGQVFKIRAQAGEDADKAIDYAKHRGPWSLFDGK